MGKIGTFFAYLFAIFAPLLYLLWRWFVVRPELEEKGQKLNRLTNQEEVAIYMMFIGVILLLMVVFFGFMLRA